MLLQNLKIYADIFFSLRTCICNIYNIVYLDIFQNSEKNYNVL